MHLFGRVAAASIIALAVLSGPPAATAPPRLAAAAAIAAAQVTEICFVRSEEYDCHNRCKTEACRQREAREAAESERRARLTPEEREAEDAAKRKEQEQRAAKERAEREARIAREAAEQRAAAAAKKARIDSVMEQLGLPEQRRAEAERLAAMREAAERARDGGKKPGPAKDKVCQAPAWKYVESWTYLPMEMINAEYAKMKTVKRCKSGKYASVAPLQCKKRWNYLGTPMGTCGKVLNCAATSYACQGGTKVSNQ